MSQFSIHDESILAVALPLAYGDFRIPRTLLVAVTVTGNVVWKLVWTFVPRSILVGFRNFVSHVGG